MKTRNLFFFSTAALAVMTESHWFPFETVSELFPWCCLPLCWFLSFEAAAFTYLVCSRNISFTFCLSVVCYGQVSKVWSQARKSHEDFCGRVVTEVTRCKEYRNWCYKRLCKNGSCGFRNTSSCLQHILTSPCHTLKYSVSRSVQSMSCGWILGKQKVDENLLQGRSWWSWPAVSFCHLKLSCLSEKHLIACW